MIERGSRQLQVLVDSASRALGDSRAARGAPPERPAVRSARVAIVKGLLVVAGQVQLHPRSYCFGRVQ
jgi:hypothetical protein